MVRPEGVVVSRRALGRTRTRSAAAVVLSVGVILCSAVPAIAVSGSSFGPAATEAGTLALQGPGFGTWDDRVGWQGGFVAPDGSLVFCAEPGEFNPSGVTTDGGFVTGVVSSTQHGDRTLTADDGARLSTIVAEANRLYAAGSLSDREASAVSFAVKFIANPDAMFQSHSWTGGHDLAGYVNWVLFGEIGGSEARAVADRAQAIIDSTAGITAGAVSGTGAVRFDVDHVNNYVGTVSVPEAPAGSTGTITLTNGVFVDSGSNVLVGATAGTPYAVRGVPPTADGAPYKISGTASFGSGYDGSLHVWDTGTQQMTIGPGNASSWTAVGEDPTERVATFQPIIVSEAPRFLEPGEPLIDTATPKLAADEDGVVNEWFKNSAGEYAPTTWTVKAWGVTSAPTETLNEVPADAVLYDTTTVTSGTKGPEAGMTAEFSKTAPTDMAIVYTWEFDAAAQPDTVQPLFGDHYWMDLFGLLEETTFVVDATSTAQISARPGEMSADVAHVTGVLPKEGLELQFEKYAVPMIQHDDGSWTVDGPEGFDPASTDPADWAWVEDDANLLGTDSQVVTKAGDYTSKPLATAPEGGLELWVHALYTVPADGADRELVDRSEIGDASERTIVLDVSTKAQSSTGSTTGVKPGTPIWDTAEAWGWIPEGATIEFAAYRVPAGSDFTCTPDTRIWESEPVATDAGYFSEDNPQDVRSAEFTPGKVGYSSKVTFIETTKDDQGRVISTGECGDPDETVTYAAEGSLAQTGGELDPTLALGGGGLLLAGLGTGVATLIRRRRASSLPIDADITA